MTKAMVSEADCLGGGAISVFTRIRGGAHCRAYPMERLSSQGDSVAIQDTGVYVSDVSLRCFILNRSDFHLEGVVRGAPLMLGSPEWHM